MNEISIWVEKHPAVNESPMDRLWNRLDGMYPSLWASKFNDSTYVNWCNAWAEAFVEERIVPDEIRAGLASLRKAGTHPPTLPEFIRHCRPPINYDKAFFEAVDQMGRRRRPVTRLVDGELKTFFEPDTWSNPAVFWAARAMGSDLDKEYRYVGARWAYELDKVLGGEVLPVPQNTNLLPNTANTSKELSEEEQANISSMIAQVHAMLNGAE